MSEDPRINLEPDWVCPIKQKQIFFFFFSKTQVSKGKTHSFCLKPENIRIHISYVALNLQAAG